MNNIDQHSLSCQILALITTGGLTARAFDYLLTRFGSPQAILAAEIGALGSVESLTPQTAEPILNASKKLSQARATIAELQNRDIRIVNRFDSEYGSLLFELNDPPPLLFVRGDMPDPKQKSVAVIGTRDASEFGIAMTTELVQRMAANGVQIISSLSGGIDSAVHLGTRSENGRPFAVLDRGFDQLYQPDSVPVAIDLAQNGGVISEYLPDVKTSEDTIEASNRILVGLSQAVVVTEIYRDSARTLDVLAFCRMIGKMAFIVTDRERGALSDAPALEKILESGAIPMDRATAADEITRVLV